MALASAGASEGAWSTIVVATAAVVATPMTTLAADSGAGFQVDPVEQWTGRVLTWVLVAAIVLVLWSLVAVVRNGSSGRPSKVAMLVGIVLLPSFAVASGMMLVFMRAERVEFCASCHHVMQDYADDMTDPAGTGLAAVHFANRYIPSNQCYECHTSYGLFGTVEAKLNGIAEVYRYYSRTYRQPIVMWHPYSNRDCLKCHADSRKWLEVDAHTQEDMKTRLFEDTTSCMTCHDGAHDVAPDGASEDGP